MGDVVYGDFNTKLDIPPDRVLEAAAGQLDTVIVVGKRPGDALYVAGSTGNLGEVFLLLERTKLFLLNMLESEISAGVER